MTLALALARRGSRATAWRQHGAALGGAAAALLLLFVRDAAQLAGIWWTSTTFGHCLFIPPVIGWLVWCRRAELARLRPVAWAPGLLAVAGGGFVWLVGAAATVAFLRQLGLVAMLVAATVTLLGPRVARGLAFPLGYAVFLVPFGEWLEAPLQRVTVAGTLPLLHLAGVAAISDGVLIHAGGAVFEVAEACSGAKFVIAMAAFATLVAATCFAGWRRRAIFLPLAILVPVAANVLRAAATIWAADRFGVAAATGFDHIVYGWVFFGLVIAATLALAWRWFDRAPDAPAFDPAALAGAVRATLPAWPAALLVLVVAAPFPLAARAIEGRRADLPAVVVLPEVPGWQRVPLDARGAWQPWYPAADHRLIGRYRSAAGEEVDMAVAVFAAQHEGAKLGAFGTGVLREEDRWIRVSDLPPVLAGEAMRIVGPGGAKRVVTSWYIVGGRVVTGAYWVKLATVAARLFGGPPAAVALHLSAVERPGRPAAAAIARMRAALPSPDRLAARWTSER